MTTPNQPQTAEETYAKMVDGCCTFRFFGTRDDAQSYTDSWNGSYRDAHHYAEPMKLGTGWAIAVFDGYTLGGHQPSLVCGYIGSISAAGPVPEAAP